MKSVMEHGQEKRRHRSRRTGLPVMVLVVMVVSLVGMGPGAALADREIVDMAGRTVRVPDFPAHIACIDGPAFEKVFAFGAADRVVLTANVTSPWARKLYPHLVNIPVAEIMAVPDVEKLMALQTDLVILKPIAKQIKSVTAAGIPAAVAYNNSERPQTMAEFFREYYDEIRFFGRVLGGDGDEIAEKYCAYMAQRIGKVLAVTEVMTAADRPRVFFFSAATNGPAGTQSKYTTAWWLVRAAGGQMVTYEDSAYFIDVSTEQMILWDPEFIVVSTGTSVGEVVSNRQLRDVAAVKAGNVLASPQGVFYWSHFSTESFLLILHLAKVFHPDLFSDLDVTAELKAYYAAFYHYDLTDDEARRILSCLPPASEERP